MSRTIKGSVIRHITIDSLKEFPAFGDMDGAATFKVTWQTLERGAKLKALPLMQMVYASKEAIPYASKGADLVERVEPFIEALYATHEEGPAIGRALPIQEADVLEVLPPWLCTKFTILCNDWAVFIGKQGIPAAWRTAVLETFRDVLHPLTPVQFREELRFNVLALYAATPSSLPQFDAAKLPRASGAELTIAQVSERLLRHKLTGLGGLEAVKVAGSHIYVSPTRLATPDDPEVYPFATPNVTAPLAVLADEARAARLVTFVVAWFENTYGVAYGGPTEEARKALGDPDAFAVARLAVMKRLNPPTPHAETRAVPQALLRKNEYAVFDTVGCAIKGRAFLASPILGYDFEQIPRKQLAQVNYVRRGTRLFIDCRDVSRLLKGALFQKPDDAALLDELVAADTAAAAGKILRRGHVRAARLAGARIRFRQAFTEADDRRLFAVWQPYQRAAAKAELAAALPAHAAYRLYWRGRTLAALFAATHDLDLAIAAIRDPAKFVAYLGADAPKTYANGLDFDLTAASSPAPAETAAP